MLHNTENKNSNEEDSITEHHAVDEIFSHNFR